MLPWCEIVEATAMKAIEAAGRLPFQRCSKIRRPNLTAAPWHVVAYS